MNPRASGDITRNPIFMRRFYAVFFSFEAKFDDVFGRFSIYIRCPYSIYPIPSKMRMNSPAVTARGVSTVKKNFTLSVRRFPLANVSAISLSERFFGFNGSMLHCSLPEQINSTYRDRPYPHESKLLPNYKTCCLTRLSRIRRWEKGVKFHS